MNRPDWRLSCCCYSLRLLLRHRPICKAAARKGCSHQSNPCSARSDCRPCQHPSAWRSRDASADAAVQEAEGGSDQVGFHQSVCLQMTMKRLQLEQRCRKKRWPCSRWRSASGRLRPYRRILAVGLRSLAGRATIASTVGNWKRPRDAW